MGSVAEAKRLIEMAVEKGADAVKLQKRNNELLYTKRFYESAYNSEAAYAPTYGKHREALEFGRDEYLDLQEYSTYLGITFIATPFDLDSLDFLEGINVPYFKIASGSITNPVLLRAVGSIGKPILASFGGAPLESIARAVEALASGGSPLVLLHCVAGYPAKPTELGLERIAWLAAEYPEYVIGYSDHDDGVAMGAVAYVHGARVFEKHVTMSHSNRGTDHSFALEPGGLGSYIRNLQEAYFASKWQDQPLESEKGPMYKMGSAAYLNRNMKAGERITAGDLVLKSPVDGLGGWAYDLLIGKLLLVNVNAEQPLREEYFE
jgi:N-acetylneuraminate synthase/sialic acid synthase